MTICARNSFCFNFCEELELVRKTRVLFHFVGNVNTVKIEQIFLLSVSSLSGTCTNFLELLTRRLGLLLAETISFREPVKRKRKCVLTTVSQCRVKEAAESSACVCGCGIVCECVCWVAERMKSVRKGERGK